MSGGTGPSNRTATGSARKLGIFESAALPLASYSRSSSLPSPFRSAMPRKPASATGSEPQSATAIAPALCSAARSLRQEQTRAVRLPRPGTFAPPGPRRRPLSRPSGFSPGVSPNPRLPASKRLAIQVPGERDARRRGDQRPAVHGQLAAAGQGDALGRDQTSLRRYAQPALVDASEECQRRPRGRWPAFGVAQQHGVACDPMHAPACRPLRSGRVEQRPQDERLVLGQLRRHLLPDSLGPRGSLGLGKPAARACRRRGASRRLAWAIASAPWTVKGCQESQV